MRITSVAEASARASKPRCTASTKALNTSGFISESKSRPKFTYCELGSGILNCQRGFAGIALLLSLLGIYGVVAYSVSERTREIAIRMALGATREGVLLRTLRHAFLLTAFGAALGLVASLGLTRLLSSLLYDVKPLDGPVMFGAILLLFLCSFLAAALPARRAAGVEPMQALRTE